MVRKSKSIDVAVVLLALTGTAMYGRVCAEEADAKRPEHRSAETIDFDRDVRQILSDTCFQCHGPDAGQRKGDLRLDVETDIRSNRDGVRLIVPGKPAESELWKRITSGDPDVRMPPTDAPRQLTQQQIGLLGRWIEQGAEWQNHWSFVPPQRPPRPAVSDQQWTRNAIDSFVLSRLESEGLKPSIEATSPTLPASGEFRPDRFAAFISGTRRVPCGRISRCLGTRSRPPAGFASVR